MKIKMYDIIGELKDDKCYRKKQSRIMKQEKL